MLMFLRFSSLYFSSVPNSNPNFYKHFIYIKNSCTVKLDFKELLNKEQIDFKELFTDYQPIYY